MKIQKLYNKYVRRGGKLYILWCALATLVLVALSMGLILLLSRLGFYPDETFTPLGIIGLVVFFLFFILAVFVLNVLFYYYTAEILRIKSTLHDAVKALAISTALSILIGISLSFMYESIALETLEWAIDSAIWIAVIKKIYKIGWIKSIFFLLISGLLILLAMLVGSVLLAPLFS
ncbi:MAG: hypothetical protein OEY44_00530 [Candidatus Peregrinibacteria bacterium]|nr:hypothetical protein [Candidatus Peregrinibacteria bacterium]